MLAQQHNRQFILDNKAVWGLVLILWLAFMIRSKSYSSKHSKKTFGPNFVISLYDSK